MERIREHNINTTEYWDGFATESYKEADRNRNGNKCKFATVVDLIPDNSDILDIGCLNGNFYNYLKEKTSSAMNTFTGVDFSTKLINMAKERFPEQQWVPATCYQLPFEDNSFDVVTAMEILEHIEDPAKALLEAKRVCRSGGSVIVTTPNKLIIDDPAHVWSFVPSDIFKLLEEISTNINVLLTCSTNRNIVGKAIIDFATYQ